MLEVGAAIFIFILIAIFVRKQDNDPLAQEVFTEQEIQKGNVGTFWVIGLGILALAVAAVIAAG